MYQSWWPKFRWIKPEIPLKPMGKSWCFFGRIPILWRIWTWKFTPNFKTQNTDQKQKILRIQKKPNSLPNLEGLVSRVRSQLRSCWYCGRTCNPEPWPPEPTHGHCFLPFPQNGGFKKPPGCPNCQAVQTSRKVPGTIFFPSPLRRTRFLELKRFGWVFIPEIQFPHTAWISGQKFFSKGFQKTWIFRGNFGEGRSPKKSPFRGVHQLAGSLVVFLMMQAFLFGNFLGRLRWKTPENQTHGIPKWYFLKEIHLPTFNNFWYRTVSSRGVELPFRKSQLRKTCRRWGHVLVFFKALGLGSWALANQFAIQDLKKKISRLFYHPYKIHVAGMFTYTWWTNLW